MERDLEDNLISRLVKEEQAAIEANAKRDFENELAKEQESAIETQLNEAGQAVRDTILEHYNHRFNRRIGWFGSKVIEMSFGQEPDFHRMMLLVKQAQERYPDDKERMKVINKISWDFQSTITTPMLLIEEGSLRPGYSFEHGWKIKLRQGSYAYSQNIVHPDYPYSQSPLYIHRAVREVSSGREESDLAYILSFPGDMKTERKLELKSYTNYVQDDEIAMVGKDAHMHALGILQKSLEELKSR